MSTTSDPRVGNRAAEADVDAAPTFPPVTLSPISELGAPRSRGGAHSMDPHSKAMMVAGLSYLRWGCSQEHRSEGFPLAREDHGTMVKLGRLWKW